MASDPPSLTDSAILHAIAAIEAEHHRGALAREIQNAILGPEPDGIASFAPHRETVDILDRLVKDGLVVVHDEFAWSLDRQTHLHFYKVNRAPKPFVPDTPPAEGVQ